MGSPLRNLPDEVLRVISTYFTPDELQQREKDSAVSALFFHVMSNNVTWYQVAQNLQLEKGQYSDNKKYETDVVKYFERANAFLEKFVPAKDLPQNVYERNVALREAIRKKDASSIANIIKRLEGQNLPVLLDQLIDDFMKAENGNLAMAVRFGFSQNLLKKLIDKGDKNSLATAYAPNLAQLEFLLKQGVEIHPEALKHYIYFVPKKENGQEEAKKMIEFVLKRGYQVQESDIIYALLHFGEVAELLHGYYNYRPGEKEQYALENRLLYDFLKQEGTWIGKLENLDRSNSTVVQNFTLFWMLFTVEDKQKAILDLIKQLQNNKDNYPLIKKIMAWTKERVAVQIPAKLFFVSGFNFDVIKMAIENEMIRPNNPNNLNTAIKCYLDKQCSLELIRFLLDQGLAYDLQSHLLLKDDDELVNLFEEYLK